MHWDVVPVSKVPDPRSVEPAHLKACALALRATRPGLGEDRSEPDDLRRPYDNSRTGRRAQHLLSGPRADQVAGIEQQHSIDHPDQRLGVRTRDQRSAPLSGEGAQEGAKPRHALGLQSAVGAVQQQRFWIAKQRDSDAKPRGHALGQVGEACAALLGEPNDVEDSFDPVCRAPAPTGLDPVRKVALVVVPPASEPKSPAAARRIVGPRTAV
ncbi:MAG TPA: hypothetical protein VFU65_08060 [Actinocrinis sp.]|nr:hypothetical protein [Actinocrinis sp.]